MRPSHDELIADIVALHVIAQTTTPPSVLRQNIDSIIIPYCSALSQTDIPMDEPMKFNGILSSACIDYYVDANITYQRVISKLKTAPKAVKDSVFALSQSLLGDAPTIESFTPLLDDLHKRLCDNG
jgi:hypothetical protein